MVFWKNWGVISCELPYYDSLIIATALENACSVLYSEDMQHNQKIENQLRISQAIF
jgi:predicted nucleic acid-binding protein